MQSGHRNCSKFSIQTKTAEKTARERLQMEVQNCPGPLKDDKENKKHSKE